MAFDTNQLDTLKTILENSIKPQSLNTHPWTESLIVFASSQGRDGSKDEIGRDLVTAIEKIFAQMMPRTPPRRGKRLDTRWGEFGILAALYFAPLAFGSPTPASLREAWGMIDRSILYFVFGKPENELTPDEKARYKLVGDELNVASHSTLSDWHRKGLQRLMDMIVVREGYLSKVLSKPAVILPVGGEITPNELPQAKNGRHDIKARVPQVWRFMFLLLGTILALAAFAGCLKVWRIYDLAQLVRKDMEEIRALRSSPIPNLEKVKQAGPALSNSRKDFEALKLETEPMLWLGPWLEWSPLYGGELSSIQDLVTVADSLLTSADTSYKAIFPILEEYSKAGINPPRLSGILAEVQPQLIHAQQELQIASLARSRLKIERFSPQVRDLILNDIDPLVALMSDGLSIAIEAPRLLGATDEGPKTYLLLVQNEDELRPTGGFITAAGTLLVQGGRISGLTFSNSGNLDNWSKLYPAPPWQLKQYMNSAVLVLRDTNWYTNFPTAALYAEYLYSYTNAHSVDGVIAFDQQALIDVLSITGPIIVDDAPYPIDAANVIAYMRSAKTPTAEQLASPDWNNKIFINKITHALVTKIFSGETEWEKLAAVLLKALNERHLLLQMDSPAITALLAHHHWDGAVSPGIGDYLMVVDTNIGFNKTNAVVESSLFYDVDLTKISNPTASLTVVHKNKANAVLVCKQWDKIRLPGEESYPITDCYWNYLRIYTAKRTQLLDAAPQFIPAGWMINNQSVPAKTDTLIEEGITNAQVFGSLQVVPVGESLAINFHFALPADVLKNEPVSGRYVYHLKLQKQAGTLAVPATIRFHLPGGASIWKTPDNSLVQNNNILLETDLRTDTELEIVFSVP